MKILICYHKLSPIIQNQILTPILCGAATSHEKEAFLNASRRQGFLDDTPLQSQSLAEESAALLKISKSNLIFANSSHAAQDCELNAAAKQQSQAAANNIFSQPNLSLENANFCELSALFWAFKNLAKQDYIGLFHYRRALDLTREGQSKPTKIRKLKNLAKFGLDEESLQETMSRFDIITPTPHECSLREHWADLHFEKDLLLAEEVIRQTYPQMQVSARLDATAQNCFTNVFVAKSELFYDYCKWIFDIINQMQPRINLASYNSYQARLWGFLSEVLFNVWLDYKARECGVKVGRFALLESGFKRRLFGWEDDYKFRRFYFLKLRLFKGRSRWKM